MITVAMKHGYSRIGLIFVLSLLGACSSTTFLYNRLDFLLPWYLGDYADLVAQGYARGVPMGGELKARPISAAAPTFAVARSNCICWPRSRGGTRSILISLEDR